MKKIILLFLFACVVTMQASAKQPDIKISQEQVTVSDNDVTVNFDVAVGRRAVRGTDIMIYRPVLTNDNSRWALPEIVVESRRGRIADARREWVSGVETISNNATLTKNGETLSYSARVPRQMWMSRARVEVEAVTIGCCTQSVSDPTLLAMVPDFTPKPVVVVVVPPTTGERLSNDFDWVQLDSEFDRDMPSRMFEQDRDGSLRVLFALDSWVLDRNIFNNGEVLDKLVATLRELEGSSDSRITGIVIAGYASPEGPIRRNDLLGQNRADALKKYLVSKTSLNGENIHLYNGAEDWAGLRMMVAASDMPSREAVLNIIDTVPIWDDTTRVGRENALMRLDGGAPYRYMLENFFPQLRSAAYIKVFYENK